MQHDFILLDRSGSMQSLWAEALGSTNTYVKKLAEDKVGALCEAGYMSVKEYLRLCEQNGWGSKYDKEEESDYKKVVQIGPQEAWDGGFNHN